MILGNFICPSFSQDGYISRIVEYHPAPGQFVNTSAWGTPGRAESLVGGIQGGISLGGYGGYIVVAFDHTIENHPDNPYGVDFTVFGNPLTENGAVTWSEPGIVMVMKDENGNGEADDTWYELAGSDHHFSTTIKNYEITYTNPGQLQAADVPWTDNQGQTGFILANIYHDQPYYPTQIHFPRIDPNQITFKGTLLKSKADKSDPGSVKYYPHGFGYADNSLLGVPPYTVPDNPYTNAIEGSGGDAFDIGWAIDTLGNPVVLDGIDFVKVYTAVNADAGWLGEVSTEIKGIVDVAPNSSITGMLSCIRVVDLPLKVEAGSTLNAEAYTFYEGKPQPGENIAWSVDDETLATVDETGAITPLALGRVTLTASLQSDPGVKDQVSFGIISPSSLDIVMDRVAMRVNTRQDITAVVKDQQGDVITGLPVSWHSSDPTVLGIKREDGRLQVEGTGEGTAWLVAYATAIPALSDSLEVQVLPEALTRQVYITIKDQQETIISRRLIAVDNFDLNAYVEDRSKNYGIDQLDGVTAAHAVAKLFENEAFASDLRFKDDQHGNHLLYLWKVPKGDVSAITYVHGFGGSEEANLLGVWLVKVNDTTYVHNLDQVNIQQEDEIVVYHIADTSTPWEFKHLTTGKDSVKTGEPVNVRASRSLHTLTANRQVTTESPGPIRDEVVRVNGSTVQKNGQLLRTDEAGFAELTFTTSGMKEVQVAGESVPVFVKGNTVVSLPRAERSIFSISPNPASRFIRLTFPQQLGRVTYQVSDAQGSPVLQGSLNTGKTLNLENLRAGLYFIMIQHTYGSEVLKFIRQ